MARVLASTCARPASIRANITTALFDHFFFPSNGDNSRHTGFMSVSRDREGMPLNTGYRPDQYFHAANYYFYFLHAGWILPRTG